MMVRVVAEAGQCMQGSVATAIEMAKQARLAGAWGFKVQLLKPETIAREDAPKYWTDKIGTADQRAAFTKAGLVSYGAWAEVKAWCDDIGIEFLATPFDIEAVEVLAGMGCRYIKIASGDITYRQLLESISDTDMEVIMSCGATDISEIDRALRWLRGSTVTLLACTLAYPTPACAAHVARISTLARQFGRPVGYSDHTSLPETGLAAAALGSTLNEVHYTLDNHAPNVPDHAMAVDPPRLARYVEYSELGASLRGNALILPAPEEEPARMGARRSIVMARDVPEGVELHVDDFAFLRPGDGLPPHLAHRLVGRRTTRPLQAGTLVHTNDIVTAR